jgi:hypothetical protein
MMNVLPTTSMNAVHLELNALTAGIPARKLIANGL